MNSNFKPEVSLELEIGGMLTSQILNELDAAGVEVGQTARDHLLTHPSFVISGSPWTIKLVRCKVREVLPTKRKLGPISADFYKAVIDAGYVCPVEVGPRLMLWAARQKKIIPAFTTVMIPLRDQFQDPYVFLGEATGEGEHYRAKLGADSSATNTWKPDDEIIFAHHNQVLRLGRDPADEHAGYERYKRRKEGS